MVWKKEHKVPSNRKSEVLMAANMKVRVFWSIALCSLITLMMEAVSIFETSVSFYEIPWRNMPEDSHIQETGEWEILHDEKYSPLNITRQGHVALRKNGKCIRNFIRKPERKSVGKFGDATVHGR
jgi:hypothetical protein